MVGANTVKSKDENLEPVYSLWSVPWKLRQSMSLLARFFPLEDANEEKTHPRCGDDWR